MGRPERESVPFYPVLPTLPSPRVLKVRALSNGERVLRLRPLQTQDPSRQAQHGIGSDPPGSNTYLGLGMELLGEEVGQEEAYPLGSSKCPWAATIPEESLLSGIQV